ncbi:hypothetical protein ES704_01604 [subsurface metagenome]
MRKRKNQATDALDTIVTFAETVDTVFKRLTGKPIAGWLREFQQQSRKLPPGEQQTATSEPVIPLVDAYAVLGLPQTATMKEVKRNYRNLSMVFHPDRGGYKEAMVLLNRAYERITKGEKVK